MTPKQQKAGIAALLSAVFLGAVWVAAQWLPNTQEPAVAIGLASSSQTHSEQANVTPASPQPMAAASSTSEPVIVHPEDAIVPEPDNDSGDDATVEKPSPQMIEAIREMKKPTSDEGKVTINPDGSQKLSLGNRYMSVPVATRGKDGTVHVNYHGERYAKDKTTVNSKTPDDHQNNAIPEEKQP